MKNPSCFSLTQEMSSEIGLFLQINLVWSHLKTVKFPFIVDFLLRPLL